MFKQYLKLNPHQNVFHYLSILFLSGIICGIVLSQIMHENVIAQLSESIFSTILSPVEKVDFFITQFSGNLILAFLLLFLGASLIGIPFISFIIFTKGVQIGFSCALYLITYHWIGMVGIIMTLLPQILFDSIAIFILSVVSFETSFLIFKRVIFNTKAIEWKSLINEKLNGVIIAFTLILLGSLLKATLVIYLMELFAMIQS